MDPNYGYMNGWFFVGFHVGKYTNTPNVGKYTCPMTGIYGTYIFGKT